LQRGDVSAPGVAVVLEALAASTPRTISTASRIGPSVFLVCIFVLLRKIFRRPETDDEAPRACSLLDDPRVHRNLPPGAASTPR